MGFDHRRFYTLTAPELRTGGDTHHHRWFIKRTIGEGITAGSCIGPAVMSLYRTKPPSLSSYLELLLIPIPITDGLLHKPVVMIYSSQPV